MPLKYRCPNKQSNQIGLPTLFLSRNSILKKRKDLRVFLLTSRSRRNKRPDPHRAGSYQTNHSWFVFLWNGPPPTVHVIHKTMITGWPMLKLIYDIVTSNVTLRYSTFMYIRGKSMSKINFHTIFRGSNQSHDGIWHIGRIINSYCLIWLVAHTDTLLTIWRKSPSRQEYNEGKEVCVHLERSHNGNISDVD